MTNKSEIWSTVIKNDRISDGIYSMWLDAPGIADTARPGQFVSVYCNDTGRMLPRPISICETDAANGGIRIVYRVAGGGTAEFSRMKKSDKVRIIGPLGNGFPMTRQSAFLIGGGIGIPPMLELARHLGGDKKIILGYRDSDTFLSEELSQYGDVYIATEDGSAGTKGNVLDAIRENALLADVIYACGPTPMLKAIKEYSEKNNKECYISLEERMACGIGACLACVCQSAERDEHLNINKKRVCKEGPVFRAGEVLL